MILKKTKIPSHQSSMFMILLLSKRMNLPDRSEFLTFRFLSLPLILELHFHGMVPFRNFIYILLADPFFNRPSLHSLTLNSRTVGKRTGSPGLNVSAFGWSLLPSLNLSVTRASPILLSFVTFRLI